MKTFFVMAFVLGTLLNGEVKIYNQYVLKASPDLGTMIYTSREQCENEILKIAKTSAEYYGENQKLTYKRSGGTRLQGNKYKDINI